MNTKKIWMMLVIALVSLCTASCGGDDDDDYSPNNGSGNGKSTEVPTDYTATTAVKTIKLVRSPKENDVTFDVSEYSIIIYEDFNTKYALLLYMGKLSIAQFIRNNGKWESSWWVLQYGYHDKAGITNVGKVESIDKIKNKDVELGANSFLSSTSDTLYGEVAQPNCGYTAYFITENEEKKHLRCYIDGYNLDNNGDLTSISIQYQLF